MNSIRVMGNCSMRVRVTTPLKMSFEIQQTIVGSSTTGNTTWSLAGRFCSIPGLGGWGFWQPTQDLAQFYMVDAQGLPYLDNEYRTFKCRYRREEKALQ